MQNDPCARLLCEVQFFAEGRSPAGRLIRDIRQLCTAYFAEGRPTEFLAGTANGSASLGKTGCQGILLRGEVFFIEVDAKALNPLKTTSIHNAARMVESCATNPIRGGPARK